MAKSWATLRCQSWATVARLDLAVLPARASGTSGRASPSLVLRTAAAWRQTRLQRRDSLQQHLLLFARLGGHRLDRLELLAADQIHAGEHPLELLAQPRFDLAAHPGQGADRAGGDPRHVVEKPVLALHRPSPIPPLPSCRRARRAGRS